MSSPAPSTGSCSSEVSLTADSGISSANEDTDNNIELPPSGGIMKKLSHRHILRHLNRPPPSVAISGDDITLSKTTTSFTTAVSVIIHSVQCDYNSIHILDMAYRPHFIIDMVTEIESLSLCFS